jgi:hypothetical protein
VPEKADVGLGPPPGIKVEVFVICDRKGPIQREVAGVVRLTYNRSEVVTVANRPKAADETRHNGMPYVYPSVNALVAMMTGHYLLR